MSNIAVMLDNMGGGGVATFSPLNLPSLRFWLRGDLGITLDGSNNVSSWADQSGNGNDFSQSNPSNRPAYNTNPFNGQPTLRFSGSVDSLLCANVLLDPTPFCIAFVLSPTSVSAATALYSSDGAVYAPIGASSGACVYNCSPTTSLVNGTLYAFIGNTAVGPSTDQYLNGTKQSGLSGYSRNARGATRIGSDAGGGVQLFSGDIGEAVYCSTTLNDTQITNLRSYFSTRYGFPA